VRSQEPVGPIAESNPDISGGARVVLKRIVRHRWRIAAALALLIVLVTVVSNLLITISTRPSIYADPAALPFNDVGLVLGSGRPGNPLYPNPHFKVRTEAAAYLFRIGKVKHLLLSGDNSRAGYNEPADMKAALLKLGVPETALTLDYAGFRTLDSVARAREVFGLRTLTIITDDFHAGRAVFLARHFDIDAVAFSPEPVPFKWSAQTRLREIAARVRAVADVSVLNKQPRYLGPAVTIDPAKDGPQ
jgi:SanA protein